MVKNQKKIKFVNDCNAIFDDNELEKAILWYQEKPTVSIKHVYMNGEYPAVSIHDEKIHIHRLLVMYWLKCRIPREYYVHHLDENKLNASKRNLVLIYEEEHQSRHNSGKTLSDFTKKLIAQSNHKRLGKKIGITKPGVSYSRIWELHEKGYSINKIFCKYVAKKTT